MTGELTPKIAESIMSSPAAKILLPLFQERVDIVGLEKEYLPHLVEVALKKMREAIVNV